MGAASVDAPAGRPRLLDVIGPEAASQVLSHLVAVRSANGTVGTTSLTTERVEPVSITVDGERILFRPTSTTLEG